MRETQIQEIAVAHVTLQRDNRGPIQQTQGASRCGVRQEAALGNLLDRAESFDKDICHG